MLREAEAVMFESGRVNQAEIVRRDGGMKCKLQWWLIEKQ
jgi:hypothetical protein